MGQKELQSQTLCQKSTWDQNKSSNKDISFITNDTSHVFFQVVITVDSCLNIEVKATATLTNDVCEG